MQSYTWCIFSPLKQRSLFNGLYRIGTYKGSPKCTLYILQA